MLDIARSNIAAARLEDRIRTVSYVDAKRPVSGQYDVVTSNSLVHHLPEPRVFFENAAKLVAPGGLLFVRDLFRPASDADWRRLVDTYAGDEAPEARQMFADSLRAALTVAEVQELVADVGFDASTVCATSDRHWTWCCK